MGPYIDIDSEVDIACKEPRAENQKQWSRIQHLPFLMHRIVDITGPLSLNEDHSPTVNS